MTRKFLSLILIFSISYTVAGYYPVFKMLQYRVRQEIKHRIKAGVNENELHVIIIRKNEHIDWVRPGKEFKLNDQLFDVVRKETRGDNFIFYCINDTQERALFTTLDQMVKSNLNDGQTTEGQAALLLGKIFTENYFCQENQLVFFDLCIEICFTEYVFPVMQIYRVTECPPPDCA